MPAKSAKIAAVLRSLPGTIALACLAACTPDGDTDRTNFQCPAQSRCPNDQRCIADRCVDTAVIGNLINLDFNRATSDDSSGSSNHAVSINGALSGPGRFGTGFDFPVGINARLDITDSPTSYVGERGTFEAWVFRETDGTNQQIFWTRHEFDIFLSKDAEVVFDAGCDDDIMAYFSGPTVVPMRTWTHIAVVRDGAELRFYKDGELREQLSIPLTVCESKIAEIIVAHRGGSFAFAGHLDELKFSDYPKTSDEISRSSRFDSTFGNEAPTSTDDSASTTKNETVEINLIDNDTDDGPNDALTIGTFGASTAGANIQRTNGAASRSLRYTPPTGFVGTDTFIYKAADANALRSESFATVTVTVIET